ncbi:type I-E CRISPR-associated protein Cse2/CasB [Streptomyces sp. NPDC020883]|uniref:type I-E CRISPR-associated protein Cse2/CasB n=1 Tax=Streptomyces sp. NPDC020883 TaxID=3365099 RepID=UPI00378F0A02
MTPTAASPDQIPVTTAPHDALAGWLAGLVRTWNKSAICALQRPRDVTDALALAGRFAPCEKDRPAFELTASLFALYHAGLPWREPVRLYGSGNLGSALRRVGSGKLRGPSDPGCDRLFKQLVAPGPVPRAHLEHAIRRLRTDDRFPPSWSQLAHDLAAWNTSQREVQHQWGRSFWAPKPPARTTTPERTVRPSSGTCPPDHSPPATPTRKPSSRGAHHRHNQPADNQNALF